VEQGTDSEALLESLDAVIKDKHLMTAAIATSTGSTAASERQACGSTSPAAATTMIAPNTALGRKLHGLGEE
jgi:hypothetical protein